MDTASEALYALKPVSFRYNKEYDATQTLAFGLIAEEVAEVIPDLVGRNPEGQPESVRYEQINAMLLNEFLKEHREVAELKSTAFPSNGKAWKPWPRNGQRAVRANPKSERTLEVNKPAPQVVLNHQ
jgi:hypothetical protein